MNAEAAAWLARLQSDDRTPHTDAAFKAWLDIDPAHGKAFEQATDVWEMLPGAQGARFSAANENPRRAKTRRNAMLGVMVAAGVCALSLLGGYAFVTRPIDYETAAGEQKVVTLRDGSRMALNTDSKIAVRLTGANRRVTLERGEVLFDVAHDPSHPFLVRAGDEQVRAVGTSFVVRRETESLAVTLLNGKVELSRRATPGTGAFIPQTFLVPGERATLDGRSRVAVDRPDVTAVTAWQHGQVVFDNVSLLEAANELNRYGPVRIVLNDPRVARLRVSGVFETNNGVEFADVMAQLNGLKVRRTAETVELTD